MIALAKFSVEPTSEMRRANVRELAYDQHAIANSDALDKIIRYEASIDRNLSRTLDRLERLQSRRREE